MLCLRPFRELIIYLLCLRPFRELIIYLSRYKISIKIYLSIKTTQFGSILPFVALPEKDVFSTRVICAGKHKFVFAVRGPLILVAVCYGNDSPPQVCIVTVSVE